MFQIIMIKPDNGKPCLACDSMWSRIEKEFPEHYKLAEERSASTWIRGKYLSMVTSFPTTFVFKNGKMMNGNPIRNYPGRNFKKEFERIMEG